MSYPSSQPNLKLTQPILTNTSWLNVAENWLIRVESETDAQSPDDHELFGKGRS